MYGRRSASSLPNTAFSPSSRVALRNECDIVISSMAAPKKALVIIAFAALYVIWGSTYLGIRFSIETIPPFLMAGARFILA